MHDVIVVGGGPAGLSAALVLGRCRRNVLVLDDGKPRNAQSRGVHGFLGLDGVEPAALRRAAHEQLARYDVHIRERQVVSARHVKSHFEVEDDAGVTYAGRKLLVATGLEDVLPEIPGAKELYGRGVYPCPYCDGWELRDRRLACYGRDEPSAELALGLTTWSRDVVLFTDTGPGPNAAQRDRLSRHGVLICDEPVRAFEGDSRGLTAVIVEGSRIERDGLFLEPAQRQRSSFVAELGCHVNEISVEKHDRQRTNVEGVYVVGDACLDVKFAIVAAAQGARAAYEINRALRDESTP